MEARQFAAEALKQTHPYLIPVSEKNNSLVAAAKNIRIELARAFPGIKFSVRSERFSMGDAIRVSWTDGPTTAQVEEITSWYTAGDFDGMTDCYNYRKDHAWSDAFGDAKYISTSRELSDDLVQRALDYLWDKYCIQHQKLTPAEFRAGKGYEIMVSSGSWERHWSVENQVYVAAGKHDYLTGTFAE